MGTVQTSGPISLDDLNIVVGNPSGTTADMDTMGANFNLTRPHGMDEFYGLTYNGPFTFTTAGIVGFSVDVNGLVSPPTATKGTIQSITYSSGKVGNYYPKVDTITQRSATIVVIIPSGYTNSGTVSGTITTSQPASAVYSFAMWDGSVTISSNGIVSINKGNAKTAIVNINSFYTVGTTTSRTIQVTLTAPDGYYNTDSTITGNVIVSQPPATFTQSDWNGSVSINKDGSISYSLGNATSFSPSPSSFAEVASLTTRTISITIGVPSTPNSYTNSGGTITFNVNVNQPATDEYIRLTDVNGNDITNITGLSGQGTSYTVYVKTSLPWNTNWTVNTNSSWGFTTTTSGVGNGSFVLAILPNYVGQVGYTGNSRSFTATVSKTGDSISDSVTFTQDVGTPPVQTPTVSITTPNSIAATSYGVNNYVTITGNVTGGSTPTNVGFNMNGGGDFAFTSVDGNVSVSNPYGNIWVGTASNPGVGVFQIGTYAINTNSNISNKTATITFTATNSAGSNSASSTITQVGVTPSFGVSTNSISSDSSGGNKSFTISASPSSLTWNISSNQSWVSASPTSGNGNANISVVIDSYTDTINDRTATITITPQSGYGLSTASISVLQTKMISTPTPGYSFVIANASGGDSCANYQNGFGTFDIYTFNYLGSLQDGATYYNADGSVFNGGMGYYSDGSVYGRISNLGVFTYTSDCSPI